MDTTEYLPESLIALVDRADVLEKAGKVDDAVSLYERWLQAYPSDTAFAAYFNLAALHFKAGRIGLAQAALRATLKSNPNFQPARARCVEPTIDDRRPMAARASYGHQQLKIAWLGHATAFQCQRVREVLDQLPAATAEHLVFAWGQDIPTGAQDISALSDDAAACKLRGLEVDVLIDMMVWNAECRPGIVAYHPASLVLSWTPNPEPSGMQAMDAVLVDGDTLAPAGEAYFEEKLLRLESAGPGSAEHGAFLLQQLESLIGQAALQLPLRATSPIPKPAELAYLTAPQAQGRRYVIVAPPFHHASAGIRVLYELQKWLVRAGYDALVCTWFAGYPIESFADDIVIYPEVAPGNLLQAKRVVRYILNAPGKLGNGEKTYGKEELLVAYNTEMAPYADGLSLQVPATEPFFYNKDGQRDKDAFYAGKGLNLHLHPPHCLEISKTFPATRRQLADFLRTVNTLYTYDDFTMLAHEAKICGCKVVLISATGEKEPVLLSYVPTIDEFRVQLNRFIEITQKL